MTPAIRTVRVRPAHLDDATAIAHIYNQGILDRIATFETAPRTPAHISAHLVAYAAHYPAVVAEHDGVVVGWAWATPYSPRDCYRGIAEFSVYVERAMRERGVGRAVLTRLITVCAEHGFWKLIARIFLDNTGSRALCARLGFREVGIHYHHAQLDGLWRDCVIVERLLDGEYAEAGTNA